MTSSFARIDFEDLIELVPAFVTIVMMVFTYNIANGLTRGSRSGPAIKLAADRAREVKAAASRAVRQLLRLRDRALRSAPSASRSSER